MSVNYPGFTGHGFDETDDSPEIEVDDWGRDIYTRVYSGPSPNLATFLKTITEAKPDSEFPLLKLNRRKVRISHAGPYDMVRVPFIGILDNKIRQPKIKAGLVERSVTLTSGTGTLTITYLAPYATAMWASTIRPKRSRITGQLLKIKGAFKFTDVEGALNPVVKAVGSDAEGVSENAMQIENTSTSEDFAYKIEVVQTQFDEESDGDGTWTVTETNEGRIVDARRSLPDFGGARLVRA